MWRTGGLLRMTKSNTTSRFKAKLLRPAEPGTDAGWAFIVLPKTASAKLPRRGRTTIDGTMDGHEFQATLEPDGNLSHWLRISADMLKSAGTKAGNTASFEIRAAAKEPEPEVPPDFQSALESTPDAQAVWNDTTTIARLDWIHWIVSAKQAKTRAKRINDACDMLASGKRRVCCFDPSGHYSKALCAPTAAEQAG
jgi:Bacteriocin-protection, YdeI or OmpD-Associated/Domain of unknown function (DUF1905)